MNYVSHVWPHGGHSSVSRETSPDSKDICASDPCGRSAEMVNFIITKDLQKNQAYEPYDKPADVFLQKKFCKSYSWTYSCGSH